MSFCAPRGTHLKSETGEIIGRAGRGFKRGPVLSGAKNELETLLRVQDRALRNRCLTTHARYAAAGSDFALCPRAAVWIGRPVRAAPRRKPDGFRFLGGARLFRPGRPAFGLRIRPGKRPEDVFGAQFGRFLSQTLVRRAGPVDSKRVARKTVRETDVWLRWNPILGQGRLARQPHFFFVGTRQNSGKTLSAAWRARVSDAQIARKVAQQLADEQSDCAFSWRWMGMSDDQRRHLTRGGT